MDKQIFGASRLRGKLTLPPDKSISHRAALFAAIAEGVSTIENYSEAADPQSTLSCLRQLGVPVGKEGSVVRIEGVGRDGFKIPLNDLDCGNSGTTIRLLSGILAGAGIEARLIGDASLSRRTMKRIIDPLREMGGAIDGREGEFTPLRIGTGRGIQGIRYPLPIASAQLKSAVLLAGLYGDEETKVIESVPSRDHTERLLQLPVEREGDLRVIKSSRSVPIPLQNYRVPGDFSAASFWLVAGAVHPDAEIVLEGVGLNPTRTGALKILQEMGAELEVEEEGSAGSEPVGRITVRSSRLRPIRLDPSLIPNTIDELPVLMVAMCFANGKSEITQAGELRHKETDRLRAMAHLLEAAGETFEVRQDGISIDGRGVHMVQSARYESEHDHRIAMAAAVMSLMAEGESEVHNAEATEISYPEFWSDLRQLSESR